MTWRKISEIEEDGTYLMAVKERDEYGDICMQVVTVTDGCGYFWVFGTEVSKQAFSHWMLLPKEHPC